MRRTIFTTTDFLPLRPQIIDRLDSSSYYFNYHIQTCTGLDPEGNTVDGYTCKTLYIEGDLSTDRIMQAWLEVFYPVDRELKLINNYNALLGGISDNEQYKDDYQAYLSERQSFRLILKDIEPQIYLL